MSEENFLEGKNIRTMKKDILRLQKGESLELSDLMKQIKEEEKSINEEKRRKLEEADQRAAEIERKREGEQLVREEIEGKLRTEKDKELEIVRKEQVAKIEVERRAREKAEYALEGEQRRKVEEGKRMEIEGARQKREIELKTRVESEHKAKEEVERIKKEEVERRVREEAERKAKIEAEIQRKEAERKAKIEAEIQRKEAERKAREEALQKEREEIERKKRAEREAREEAERKRKEEAKQKAKEEEERKIVLMVEMIRKNAIEFARTKEPKIRRERIEKEKTKIGQLIKEVDTQQRLLEKKKARFVSELNEIKRGLNRILENEKKVEEEKKVIEQKEENAPLHERGKIEKQRWRIEKKRQGIEEEKWRWEEKSEKAKGEIGKIEQEILAQEQHKGELIKKQEEILEREEMLNLEVEKIRLENTIKNLDKRKKLSEEKRSKLFVQLDQVDNELDIILDQEREAEKEVKEVEEKEMSASNAKDRKAIERERWKKEKERENIETGRWKKQQEKSALDVHIRDIETVLGNLVSSKKEIEVELTTISEEIENPEIRENKRLEKKKAIAEKSRKAKEETEQRTKEDAEKKEKTKVLEMAKKEQALRAETEWRSKQEVERQARENTKQQQKKEERIKREEENKKKQESERKKNEEIEDKAKEDAERIQAEDRKKKEELAQLRAEEDRKKQQQEEEKKKWIEERLKSKEEELRAEQKIKIANKEKQLLAEKETKDRQEGNGAENISHPEQNDKNNFALEAEKRNEQLRRINKDSREEAGVEDDKNHLPPGMIRVIPKKPTAKEKLWVRVLIFGLLLILLVAISTFWYWYLVIRQQPPALPGPEKECVVNLDCLEGEICNQNGFCEQLEVPPSFLLIDNVKILTVSGLNQIEPLLKNLAQEEQEYNVFTRIVIEKNNEVINLKDFLESLQINLSEDFYQKLGDEFNLFIYSQEEGNRIGFATSVLDKNALSNLLASQETTLKDDFRNFLTLMENEANFNPFPYFRNTEEVFGYVGPNFRFQTIAKNDFGVCYMFSGNYFLFTTSWKSMEKVIEKLP